MHEHSTCQHRLAYCPHCDVVYCKLCNREWGKTSYYVYPWYPPTYTPSPTWADLKITCDSSNNLAGCGQDLTPDEVHQVCHQHGA